MSFRLKRLVKRAIATLLVTITFISVVPIGVFTPFVSYADEENVSIKLAKPKKNGDVFVSSEFFSSDWLGSDPALSEDNEIVGSLEDAEGTSLNMLDTVPSILYRNGDFGYTGTTSKYAYLLFPYNDGNIIINNSNKNNKNPIFVASVFSSLNVLQGKTAPVFAGCNTTVDFNSTNYLKFIDEVSVSGGNNSVGGDFKYIKFNGDWGSALVNNYLQASDELLDIMLLLYNKSIGDDVNKIYIRTHDSNSNEYGGYSLGTSIDKNGLISLVDDNGKLKIPLLDGLNYKINSNRKSFTYENSSGKTETVNFIDVKDWLKYDIILNVDDGIKLTNGNVLVEVYNKGFIEGDYLILDRLVNELSKNLDNKILDIIKEQSDANKEGETATDDNTSQDAAEALENGKALETWMLLVNNFFNTGDTKIEDGDRDYLGLRDGAGADYYEKIKLLDLKDYGWEFVKKEFRTDESGFVWGAPGGESVYDKDILGDSSKLYLQWANDADRDAKMDDYRLNAYDDLRLRIYYSIQSQYRYPNKDIVQDINDAKKVLEKKFAVNNSVTTTSDELGVPNFYYKDMEDNDKTKAPDIFKDKTEILADATKAAQSEFPKTDADTTPNVKVLASNFNAVMKYITWGTIMADSDKDYSDAASSTAAIPYSENTMRIIPSLELDGGVNVTDSNDESTTIMSATIDFSKFGLPELANINRIANNEFAKNKASQLYLSLMYLKKYASLPKEYDEAEGYWVVKNEKSIGGLKLEGDDEFKDYKGLKSDSIINPDIEDFLKDTKDMDDEEKKKKAPEPEVGAYMRAYISIHDGMDYIGLSTNDDWISPELEAIYNYYDKIKYWKDVVAQSAYDPSSLEESQPFGEFFQLPGKSDSGGDIPASFSDYIRMGIGASATYLPLVTNTFDYDAISVVDDPDFVDEFHYKYGFHRKALFIDSNSNAALQSYVTGQKDSLRVATLEDFMQPDKDIVLYIDPNFYNIKSLAEKQNLSYNKLQNTEEAGKEDTGLIQGVADMWSEWRNLDAASICKTAGANLYSDALGNSAVQAYGTDASEHNFWDAKSKNHYVLSTDAIDTYYKQDEYSDVQSFAFVSGIYRCASLLNICQKESANPKPVFVSSPTLPFVEGVSKKEFNSIYNYLMVKNLKANLGLDYKTELDLDSPLFIDVYGNITTQSGLVVIPAASNATLYEPDGYSIVTAGLASLAANVDSWQIPVDSANVSKYLDNGFVKDQNTETYKMQNKATPTVELNFSNLPLQSDGVKTALYNDAYVNSGTGAITGNNTFNSRVNMIMEVMRGAPIENIDFETEGLAGYRNLDKTGIYIAYRIEQLGDMLLSSSEGNSLLKMPNLAFMEGVEYIVVIVFKILLAFGVFLLWFKLYADGATNSIGLRTGLDFMLSIASVVIGIVLIPTLINFSYYQTNKQLLQNEAAYLLLLNTEKNAEGKEVGVKEVKSPSSTTKFYIKLNEIKVPWWTVIQDVYSSEMFAKMEDVYEDAYSSSIYSTFPGAMKRGNGIYINTDDLFKSSEIRFVTEDDEEPLSGDDENKLGHLEQAVLPNNRMSYVLPYYAIIDKVLYDAECYNNAYSSSAYRTKILQNGNVRTIGLLEAYFKSNQFLQSDEMNLFGFYDIYGVPYSTDLRQPFFNEESLNSMSKSLWYNKDAFTPEEVEYKLEKLDELGRQFIVDNRTLLNKVTDETFIKVFALYMSVQHNNLFKVPAARGIELMEIDTKDIIRLSLAPKADVMHSISMSFGRFTFTQAGTFGTILMAFLLLIYYFTSLIKPIVMIILVGGLIFSYVWKKLMRYEQNHSLEGYIVSCALICLVNLIYALVIKVSVMLPDFGVDPIFSILMQIVLQAAYVGVLYLIGYVVLKNCRDLGYFTYKSFYDAHMANKIQSLTMSANKLMANSIFAPFSNTANSMRNDYLSNRRTAGLTGDDIYTRMQQNDEMRRNDVYNNHDRRY